MTSIPVWAGSSQEYFLSRLSTFLQIPPEYRTLNNSFFGVISWTPGWRFTNQHFWTRTYCNVNSAEFYVNSTFLVCCTFTNSECSVDLQRVTENIESFLLRNLGSRYTSGLVIGIKKIYKLVNRLNRYLWIFG